MRIISGKYGGRRLVSFKASHIRPTTDRVKESLFNSLMDRIEGARVLDLFAGTGNLSFESLSRGAAEVWAVEKSKQSLQIIKQNQELLKVGAELKIVGKDVLSFLRQEKQKFNLILIDPPFTEAMADLVLQELGKSDVLAEDCEVFIESSRQEPPVQEVYTKLSLKNSKAFGDKYLSHYILG